MVKTLTLDEKMETIDRLSQEMLEENKVFTPLYPWVFLLVCTKQQKVGSIILPEKQNKVVHEGIVLATWREKLVERGTVNKDGVKLTRIEVKRSELAPGDRVLFHHFAGRPVYGYDSERFRVVKEIDWNYAQEGGIFARIDVHDRQTRAVADLVGMIQEFTVSAGAWTKEEQALLEAKIEDQFVVVDRETQSVTLSGR